ncbi:uncharacterized protein TEOVI_000408400 [Trypanosoma equiperdum]|uniref:Uncharacterized protein n=1 Tax=Trypanosoma equiperdum TaxID=5694 RepID=A0A1G4IJK4_TRYEQ|nr:hypothetical protein TEOVI_000408400 [Trypanosoma equiperdum]
MPALFLAVLVMVPGLAVMPALAPVVLVMVLALVTVMPAPATVVLAMVTVLVVVVEAAPAPDLLIAVRISHFRCSVSWLVLTNCPNVS